jgi:glycosyltransferase involved in cell wall biosynthesis
LPKVIYFNLLTFFSVFKARLIFTLSIFTRNEIHRLYPFLSPDKIQVISPGIPTRCINEKDSQSILEILDNIKLQPRSYIISISTVEPSKNYLHCISAFRIFLQHFPNFHYVIVGKRGWGDKQGTEYRKIVSHIYKKGLQERVHLTGFLDSHRLQSLLSQAACLLYASLHEGFGIPLLEAMQAGVPVITSNISSMPEIAGNAAILVNPYSEKSIAEGLIRLFGNSAKIEKLVKLGNERQKIFSWDNGVEKFLTIMQKENLILHHQSTGPRES